MTRERGAIARLWGAVAVLLVVAALAAGGYDDGGLDVVAQGGCGPATSVTVPDGIPPTGAGGPGCVLDSPVTTATAVPTTTVPVVTTAAPARPSPRVSPRSSEEVELGNDLALPPGDYDRITTLKEQFGSGARGQAAAWQSAHTWQVTVVAEGLVPGGEYHLMAGRPGIEWPTPCMFVASRRGRGMCTGRMYGDDGPPEMVALMGPSGLVQASGTFV